MPRKKSIRKNRKTPLVTHRQLSRLKKRTRKQSAILGWLTRRRKQTVAYTSELRSRPEFARRSRASRMGWAKRKLQSTGSKIETTYYGVRKYRYDNISIPDFKLQTIKSKINILKNTVPDRNISGALFAEPTNLKKNPHPFQTQFMSIENDVEINRMIARMKYLLAKYLNRNAKLRSRVLRISWGA